MGDNLRNIVNSKVPGFLSLVSRQFRLWKYSVNVSLSQRRVPDETDDHPKIANRLRLVSLDFHRSDDALQLARADLTNFLRAEFPIQPLYLSTHRCLSRWLRQGQI